MDYCDRGWRFVICGLFAFLCARFVVASWQESSGAFGSSAAVLVGGFALGSTRSTAGLFAFTAGLALLNGLNAFFNTSAATTLAFIGFFFGHCIRPWTEKFLRSKKNSLQPGKKRDGWIRFFIDVLITIVLISLARQLLAQRSGDFFRQGFWLRSTWGFADPHYFLASAFLWLQGLFFFRILIRGHDHDETESDQEAMIKWVRPIVAIYSATVALFFLLQCLFSIPQPYTGYGYFSPFEDISSFGSVIVALFAFVIASRDFTIKGKMAVISTIWVVALLGMLIASYSRATWLAAALVLVVIAWIRLSKKWTAIAFVTLGALALIINLCSSSESWKKNLYLARLSSLVRLESPTQKMPERFNLYQKAAGMIQERPIAGHGIGSFYLTSTRYARAGDPYGPVPDFAHNTFLLVAAEVGIPSAMMIAVLAISAMSRGYQTWKHSPDFETSKSALGACLALAIYLLTQMTANSLNVYVSNQFFFWFLVAAMLVRCGTFDKTRIPCPAISD